MSHMTACHNPLDKIVSTAVIFFDLSKAFDHVSHLLPLFYLHYIGITSLLHHWFRTTFQEEKKCVVSNGQTSSLQDVSSQGSILGPLLFTIYMNGLFKAYVTKVTKLVLNTDDIVLYKPLTAARHLCYF